MKYTISPDRHRLTIRISTEEQAELRELGEEIHQDATMADFLEPITCNSELEWIPEGTTGDLTTAPMLGIWGEEKPFNKGDETVAHRITGPNMVELLEDRWAFEPYQVRSVLQDLMEKGEAVFVDSF